MIDRSETLRGAALAAVIAASIVPAGCAPSAPPPSLTSGPPPAVVVARVGGVSIGADHVARIAATHALDLRAARDVAIHDALLAREAEAQGLADAPAVRFQLEAMLARRLLRALQAELAKPPITDRELAQATDRHWLEIARPEGFRTIHALIRLDETAPPEKRQRAAAIAASIHAAVRSTLAAAGDVPLPAREPPPPGKRARPPGMQGPHDDADPLAIAFKKAAEAVPHEGFELIVQTLPAVSADGRAFDTTPVPFDPVFCRSAAALGARGDLAPVTTSSFGAHVLVLLERVPPALVGADDRRAALRDEIITERTAAAQKRLLADLRARATPAPDADALLALVPVR